MTILVEAPWIEPGHLLVSSEGLVRSRAILLSDTMQGVT